MDITSASTQLHECAGARGEPFTFNLGLVVCAWAKVSLGTCTTAVHFEVDLTPMMVAKRQHFTTTGASNLQRFRLSVGSQFKSQIVFAPYTTTVTTRTFNGNLPTNLQHFFCICSSEEQTFL